MQLTIESRRPQSCSEANHFENPRESLSKGSRDSLQRHENSTLTPTADGYVVLANHSPSWRPFNPTGTLTNTF